MNIYHIHKTERGWELRKKGATRPSKVAATQEQILQLTAQFMQHKYASVLVHHEDGSVQEERRYPNHDASRG